MTPTKKLYDLERGAHFRVVHGLDVPPDAPEVEFGTIYKLHNIDGMYSYCTDKDGNVVHVAAYADVEELP